MSQLRNLKRSVNEIAQLLAQNDIVCKLLFNDESSALTDPRPDVTFNELISGNYICMYPPVESRIEDYGRNTFITVLLDTALLHSSDDNTTATVVLYISTNEDHILLDNNANRLLEMCDEVINILDNKKLSTAGTINISSITHVMLSEFHAAYRLNLRISDQHSRKAEI